MTETWLAQQIWPQFSRVNGQPGTYLANHSLGRPLDRMARDVAEGVDAWYEQMGEAWDAWFKEVSRFQANVGELVGLPYGSGIVPKSSVGQGLRAVLNAFPLERKLTVVATRGEFDSLDFILKTYVLRGRINVRWVEPIAGPVALFEPESVLAAIDDEVDLVLFPSVFYATGQIMAGVDQIVTKSHQCGALVMVDVYHAAGVIPLDMFGQKIDFLVGGCYKYLRGGPGACFLAIRPSVFAHTELRTLDTGWFAKKDPFAYFRTEVPEVEAEGRGWFESTFPVLPFYQARSGLEFTLEIGVAQLRSHSLDQLAQLRAMIPAIQNPPDPTKWGAFALLSHPDAAAVAAELKRGGVTVDVRNNFVRICPDILTTQAQLIEAADIIAHVLGKVKG